MENPSANLFETDCLSEDLSSPGPCLICGNHGDEGVVFCTPSWSPSSPTATKLGPILYNYFVLKHVLDLPSELLESYFRAERAPPESWVAICGRCDVNYVQKCREIFVEVLEAKRRFVEVRLEVIAKIKKSEEGEKWTKGPEEGPRGVRRAAREFVGKQDYEHLKTDEFQFLAGDLIATAKAEEDKILKDVTLGDARNEVVTIDQELLNKLVEIVPYFSPDSQSDPKEISHCSDNDTEVLEASRNDSESNSDASQDNWKSRTRSSSSATPSKKKDSTARARQWRHLQSKNKFSCDLCSKPCHSELSLRQHHIRTHKTNFYECTSCFWKTTNKVSLRKHVFQYHKPQGVPPTPADLTCPQCQKVLSSKAALKLHLDSVHNNKGDAKSKHRCDHCGKEYVTRKGLLYHLGSVHGQKDGLQFPCSFDACDKAFHSSHQLAEHEAYHKPAQFECSECGDSFFLQRYLQRHLELHKQNGSKPFQCDQCPTKFSRKDNLKKHRDTAHSPSKNGGEEPGRKKRKWVERQTFKCSECGIALGHRKALIRHAIKKHGGKGVEMESPKRKVAPPKFECDQCPKSFERRGHLERHQYFTHKINNNNLFQCPKCDWKTVQKFLLKRHLSKIHRLYPQSSPAVVAQEPVTCVPCQKTFASAANFRIHKAIKHCLLPKKTKFCCPHCPRKFSSKQVYMFHLGTVHGLKQHLTFRCAFEGCFQAFYVRNQLTRHQERYHQGVKHRCHLCPKEFTLKTGLQRHLLWEHVNHGEKRYSCDLCPARYSQESLLKSHVQKKHSCNNNLEENAQKMEKVRKKIKCSKCGENFGSREDLCRHLGDVHEMINQDAAFRCRHCDRVFSSKSNLAYHVSAVHQRKEQAACDLCGKVVTNRFNMKLHKRRVHGIGDFELRRYSCPVEGCGKTFEAKVHVTTHVDSVHTGDRKFPCDQCDKRLISKASLRRHVKVMHSRDREEKPWKCEECGKGFAAKEYLWLHKKVHQPKKT